MDRFWSGSGLIFGPILDRVWAEFGPILDRFWTDSKPILDRFWLWGIRSQEFVCGVAGLFMFYPW